MFKLRLLFFFLLFLSLSCQKDDPKTFYTLNVRVSPPGSGNVSPTSATFEAGEIATILASPNNFYVFKNWSGDWYTSDPQVQIQITMDSNKILVANFLDIDEDDDMVIDSNDICPNTSPGFTVDNFGCSISQADPDGDGVFLENDLCPGTDSGKIVDNFGCPDVLYLDSNGVTIKGTENARVGSIFPVNGINYEVVSEYKLRSMIELGEDLSFITTTRVEDMSRLFRNIYFSNGQIIREIKGRISHWDTSNVIDMSEMFYEYSKEIPDISSWDVSSVSNMRMMFFNSNFNGTIDEWDTRSVLSFERMFEKSSFDKPIGSWNTESAENMEAMFAQSNFNQDISNWDVSKVIHMAYMFANNNKFDQPIGNWNVGKVKNMSGMFQSWPYDSRPNSIFNQDISGWDTSSVLDMSGMFYNSVFNQPIGNWDVSKVTNMSGMFFHSQFDQPIGDWDVSKVTLMDFMFNNSQFNQDISKWNVSSVVNMNAMFFDNRVFNQDLSAWNVYNVSSCLSFYNERGLFKTENFPLFINCSFSQ